MCLTYMSKLENFLLVTNQTLTTINKHLIGDTMGDSTGFVGSKPSIFHGAKSFQSVCFLALVPNVSKIGKKHMAGRRHQDKAVKSKNPAVFCHVQHVKLSSFCLNSGFQVTRKQAQVHIAGNNLRKHHFVLYHEILHDSWSILAASFGVSTPVPPF